MGTLTDIRAGRDTRNSFPYRGLTLREGWTDAPGGPGACIDVYHKGGLIEQLLLEPGRNNLESLKWEIATGRFARVLEHYPRVSELVK
jgi:hypothetical protein